MNKTKVNRSMPTQRQVDEMNLESKDADDASFELTPENIANERRRQVERELREEDKEEQHRYKATTDNIQLPGKLKGDEKCIERNIQRECRSGTDLTKSQTMDREESVHGNTANRRDVTFESEEDEFCPENIVNDRLKQIEREASYSEQDANVSIKQVRRRPLAKIVSGSHAEKEERDADNELDSQKSSCIGSTNIDKPKQPHNDIRGKADSAGIINQIPGAFAIRGFNETGDDDICDSVIFSEPSPPPPSNEIFAETVDDEELATRYSLEAKEKMREKIKAEAATATKIHPSYKDKETSSMVNYKRLTLVLVAISTIALGLGLGLSNGGKKSVMTTIPSSPPTLEPSSSDIKFLQDLFLSISGDSVLNSSSPQYMALEWLANDDPFVVAVKNEEISSLSARYALSVLYFSTNGFNWTKNTQYLSNVSVCEWQSIDCNVLGSVVEINMANNNMHGKIPSELTVLSELEGINFYGNYLTSMIPDAISNLSRLELFEVGKNYLTGPIPNSFSQLMNLEALYLGRNMLTGTIPQGLANITTLERLGIYGNLLSGTIPSFAQRNLDSIWISDNELEGSIPDSILRLENLEYLELNNNMRTGTISSNINRNIKLLTLYLDGNQFSGIIPTTIGELEYLEQVRLLDNNFNGTIPSEFGQLTKLILMDVDNNQLTGEIPSEIGLLSDLLWFAISGNSITGTVPLSLSELSNIVHFQVSNTSLSGDLDVRFCYPYSNNSLLFLEADCGGPFPEVTCTCCTKCCNDDSNEGCDMRSSVLCQNYIDEVESLSDMAVCTCTDNNARIPCYYVDNCQTCNEDETICGTSIEFGWKNNYRAFTNTFTYNKGRRTDTIIWEEHWENDICNVNVNGNECDICTYSICDDGYIGLYIDCTNIIQDDESGLYDSCSVYNEGGIFDVFSWMDFESWTGCPFITTSFWD